MGTEQSKKEVRSNYLIFSGVEFIYRIITFFAGYLTVFLQGNGMSASVVGTVGAVTSAVGIGAGPLWGMLSDKIRSVRKVFLIVLVLSAVTWIVVPASINVELPMLGTTLGFLFLVINAMFRIPSNSLMDSWIMQSTYRHNLVYGSVRIWGSIGFALIGFVLSALMTRGLTVNHTFILYAVFSLLLFIFCLFIRDDAVASRSISFKDMDLGSLFRSYYFVTYLIFAIIIYIPTNSLGAFIPYLMDETGVNKDLFGLISGYRALLEVPILISMVRLQKRFSLPQLMITASVLYVIECFAYSFINGFWPLMILQTLHGIAGGTFIACGVIYVFQLAPGQLKATAQAVSGSVNAMAGIIGNLLGGFLVDSIGVRGFYAVAGAMILAAALYFGLTFLIGKKVCSDPSPFRVTHSEL